MLSECWLAVLSLRHQNDTEWEKQGIASHRVIIFVGPILVIGFGHAITGAIEAASGDRD